MKKVILKTIKKINRVISLEKKEHLILFRLVSFLLIVAFLTNLFAFNNQTALGATYTFSQTSWSGGITANNAVHPTNQSSWTQFSASTTGMTTANSGADLQLLSIASSTIHTTDTDFSAGTVGASTTVSGIGSGASVKLNTGVDLGTGADGALTVSSAGQNINTYASAGANNYSAGATSITVDSTTGFSTGDEVLVIQMQHASNAGKYEFVDSITVVNSTTISFSTGLTNAYYGTGSSGKTQVIRVPQYTNVTVNSGASIVPTAWSNTTGKGGIVVFRANGTVTVTGSIDASGMGYAGGAGMGDAGTQGESYGGVGIRANPSSANYGGGGGGGWSAYAGNNWYNSGGGGGYGSAGGDGSGGASNSLDRGVGGLIYGINTLATFFAGSGGGGGSSSGAAGSCGNSGANGGGAVIVFANAISVTGTIKSNGNSGVQDVVCEHRQGGGGGSGGSIYLISLNMTVGTSLVQATGGSGGAGSGGAGHTGGAGGNGRIRLDYSTLSGTTNPSAGYTSTTAVSDTSGTFTSPVIDYTASSAFTTLAYTKTTPTNSTITADIRAGNTATPDGSWTSWQTDIASGGSISALNGNRYVQYRANLSRTDTAVDPSLDDITINYTQYATSTDLTSSAYNTSDTANILSSIQWTESLASGTDVKFQLRTAPNDAGSPGTWTSWLGPDGTSNTYFTDPAGGEAMPSAFTSGGNDQWVQYKVFMTSTGLNTPTLSDITLTYVVNAAPSIQTITASQGSTGTVSISYEVKDTDTNSGTVNPGYITPSFEYWNGSSWASITSGLTTLATTTKAVNQSTFTSYSTIWTASTTIGSQYYSAAKIRVTANDGEAANNTANAESSTFVLDTTAPVSASIIISATTTPAKATLSASDNSSLQMKVGLNSDLSDASWETYSTTKTISLATDPDTVYAKFKDAYGNESSTVSASSQTTPSGLMIQDTSNINATPDELRLFLAWNVVADPSLGFGSYHIYRSTDGASWSLLSSIGTRATNYYTDSAVSAGTTYYYKIATIDASGNGSYLSATTTGVANGIQDGSEGGGGTSSSAPSISSVSSSNTTTQSSTVSWTTDTLSNSTVGYCSSPCSDYTTNQVAVSSYVTSHSVALAGLSPNTAYNYKVFSTDASSNTASSSVYTLTANSGPSISSVSVTKVNNVSADITWNTNIAASGYVVYSTATPPSGGEAGSASTATSRTVSLSSLTGGTKYYFYVKSRDADGNWAYDYNVSGGQTNYYSFTTPSDSVAPTISNIASTTGRTSAVITWSTNEDANSKIIYGATTAYGSETTPDSTLTMTHAVSLSGLTPGTAYYYKAISSDGAGNQATSSEYILTTETLSLTGITATTPTNTTATITWTTSDNATSQAEYSTFSDLSSSTSYPTSPSNSATSHSISLTGLSEGVTYYYRVNSAASGLGTTTSQIYQFTTGDSVAPVVSSVSSASVKDTSAVITWTTDEPSNSKVQYGTVSGSYTSSTTLSSTLTRNHSAAITGLSYQTVYYYRVLSTDGNSNATTSSESSFTTLEEQIGKSLQTITTTTVVSGGGGGSVYIGVPQDQYDTLKKERDVFKKEIDDLKDKIIGINTGSSASPAEIISVVIKKFTEIAGNLSESAITAEDQPRTKAQAEKLENDILPAVISLRQLTKLIPSPKLKTEPKLEIGATQATVSWMTDKPATSVVYFSEAKDYSEKDQGAYTNSAEDSKNYVTEHKVSLKGLTPLSDYHYRLMSESEAGAKAYSADFTFTTKPEMPKITQAKAEKSGETSITVSWKTNIPANSSVVYTPVIAGKPDIKKSKSEGLQEFSQEHSITIPRLEPSAVYNLEAVSIDHFGNVVAEKLESMSIAKDETPPVITQVRNESSILSGASSSKVQAIFYWKTDEPATTRVIYSKGSPIKDGQDKFEERSNLNEELSLNHIAVVTSWEPGEIYRFRAVSADAYGNESQSKTFAVIAPKQKATVVDLIINNFSETFDWTKKLGM